MINSTSFKLSRNHIIVMNDLWVHCFPFTAIGTKEEWAWARQSEGVGDVWESEETVD